MESKQLVLADSELILNDDGSVYHLHLLPEDLADTVITVGDPDRVPMVSRYFDSIELKKAKREFVTHTGWLGKQRITVVSSGIGTDNIDITLNELDALANIDLSTRTIKSQLKSLKIIRLGTCGGLHAETPVDSFVTTSAALGFDSLMHFYDYQLTSEEQSLQQACHRHFNAGLVVPYSFMADAELVNLFSAQAPAGITATFSGFYGPQMRQLRARVKDQELWSRLDSFTHKGQQILNFEMETAGILGLSRMLGHKACAVSLIVANRARRQFSSDVEKATDKLIKEVLSQLTSPNVYLAK